MTFRFNRNALALLCICGLASFLVSCGGGYTAPIPDPYQAVISNPATQQQTASTWSAVSPGEQSFTVPMTSLTQESCLSCMGIKAPSCKLLAGSIPMSFDASASASWFQFGPLHGDLPANGSTPITLTFIDTSLLPINAMTGTVQGTFKGTFRVRAPNYKDNNQLNFSLTCGLKDSSDGSNTCHFAMVCPPCSINALGNTLLDVTEVARTNGGTPSAMATFTLLEDANLHPGTQVVIAGAPDASLDGTFIIASVPATNQFSILQPNLPNIGVSEFRGTAYVPETISCP